MQRVVPVCCTLLLGLVVLLLAPVVKAQEIQVEVAQHPVRFLTIDSGREDRKIEPSAVEPIGDGGLLLVADDENQDLLVVEAATGRIKQSLKLGTFEGKPKWEAMARDDEGTYYVIGSHSVSDPTEKDAPRKLKYRSRLFRFRVQGGSPSGTPFVVDTKSVIEWDVTDALAVEGYNRDPLKNKVKIEGMAVRMLREPARNTLLRQLVFGLREPDNPVRVYAADITELPVPKSTLALQPLFTFDAGTREGVRSQLSSLEYVPPWKGFLILTSTEDTNNGFHGNTLWFLSDEKIVASLPPQSRPDKLRLADLQPVSPQKVWLFGVDGKAEGLCVLSEEAASRKGKARRARLAVVYDNDTPKTGMPGLLQFFTLVRWPE